MPQNTIDVSFIEEFESGVHMAYQLFGSMLRNTIRTRNNVKNKTTFQKVGKGAATQKPRNAAIPPMNIDHSTVPVTVEDWFAGEWIDDLDTLRINHDEFQVAQRSGAGALGRKTDELIFTALDTTTKEIDLTGVNFTLTKLVSIMTTFGNTDVPDEGQRYMPIPWITWGKLLEIPQFANQDWVGADALPFKNGMQAKRWNTFMIFPHSGVIGNGSDELYGFAYHRNAAGHAIGKDVSTNVQYYNTHDSHFVMHKMQMNAVLIDENGDYRLRFDAA